MLYCEKTPGQFLFSDFALRGIVGERVPGHQAQLRESSIGWLWRAIALCGDTLYVGGFYRDAILPTKRLEELSRCAEKSSILGDLGTDVRAVFVFLLRVESFERNSGGAVGRLGELVVGLAGPFAFEIDPSRGQPMGGACGLRFGNLDRGLRSGSR